MGKVALKGSAMFVLHGMMTDGTSLYAKQICLLKLSLKMPAANLNESNMFIILAS